MTLSRLEARNLASLIAQFAALVTERDTSGAAMLARLTPTAYPGDQAASEEFRRHTSEELLQRRGSEADVVLAALADAFAEDGDDPAAAPFDVVLDQGTAWVWMRTLNALRLVLAERLGITDEADIRDHDDDYAIYDWIGYRLETIVHAASAARGTDTRAGNP